MTSFFGTGKADPNTPPDTSQKTKQFPNPTTNFADWLGNNSAIVQPQLNAVDLASGGSPKLLSASGTTVTFQISIDITNPLPPGHQDHGAGNIAAALALSQLGQMAPGIKKVDLTKEIDKEKADLLKKLKLLEEGKLSDTMKTTGGRGRSASRNQSSTRGPSRARSQSNGKSKVPGDIRDDKNRLVAYEGADGVKHAVVLPPGARGQKPADIVWYGRKGDTKDQTKMLVKHAQAANKDLHKCLAFLKVDPKVTVKGEYTIKSADGATTSTGNFTAPKLTYPNPTDLTQLFAAYKDLKGGQHADLSATAHGTALLSLIKATCAGLVSFMNHQRGENPTLSVDGNWLKTKKSDTIPPPLAEPLVPTPTSAPSLTQRPPRKSPPQKPADDACATCGASNCTAEH